MKTSGSKPDTTKQDVKKPVFIVEKIKPCKHVICQKYTRKQVIKTIGGFVREYFEYHNLSPAYFIYLIGKYFDHITYHYYISPKYKETSSFDSINSNINKQQVVFPNILFHGNQVASRMILFKYRLNREFNHSISLKFTKNKCKCTLQGKNDGYFFQFGIIGITIPKENNNKWDQYYLKRNGILKNDSPSSYDDGKGKGDDKFFAGYKFTGLPQDRNNNNSNNNNNDDKDDDEDNYVDYFVDNYESRFCDKFDTIVKSHENAWIHTQSKRLRDFDSSSSFASSSKNKNKKSGYGVNGQSSEYYYFHCFHLNPNTKYSECGICLGVNEKSENKTLVKNSYLNLENTKMTISFDTVIENDGGAISKTKDYCIFTINGFDGLKAKKIEISDRLRFANNHFKNWAFYPFIASVGCSCSRKQGFMFQVSIDDE